MQGWWLRVVACLGVLIAGAGIGQELTKPNVLFIAVDDLNDWIGCMGGHSQTVTPNMDRLAASGVLFTNAHCASASCNPSRSAIFSGLAPYHSGLYRNDQKMRKVVPDAELIPAYFRRNGYRAMGSGKMLHYFTDARSWDAYFPKKETENPFPRTYYPKKRPVNFPYESWMYREADWAELPVDDLEYGGDFLVSDYVGKQLRKPQEKPFFLACGIYRPHEPWFVPAKYYKPFPLDKLKLPPGYKEGDLDDLPAAGKRRGPNRYFKLLREHNQWEKGVRGYLASIHYADAMLGRVLDALESGPHADNTIVVLWSDHGWHLGEKEHWQKFTGWRACTRVPLMIRVPKGTPGLAAGTTPGTVCDQPVSLLDLYRSLTDLTGIPDKSGIDGESLVPLLKNEKANWRKHTITHIGDPKSYAMSGNDWRYVHYANGDEELYNIKQDPYEWTNLAQSPEHASILKTFRRAAPKKLKPAVETGPDFSNVIPKKNLTWYPAGEALPKNVGDHRTKTLVVFKNQRKTPVKVFWMGPNGPSRVGPLIKPGDQWRSNTYFGHIWLVTDQNDTKLGHFISGQKPRNAVIPKRAIIALPRRAR